MANLDDVRRLGAADHGLAVVSTIARDGAPHSSVVNAGTLDHPVDGRPVVGFVLRSATAKHRNLRRDSRASLVFRSGWQWAGVSGPVDLVGPDDPLDGFDLSGLPALLRDVFTAAGGTHENWEAFDAVMAEEHRLAALIRPERIVGN